MVLPQELLRDGVQLHVARPFVNRADLGIAVKLLHRVLLGVAVAAKQLHRERRPPLGDLGGEQLRHRRLGGIWLTRGLEAARLMVYNAARLETAGEPYTTQAASSSVAACASWNWTA